MNDYTIRPMTIEDYEEVYALWTHIQGFGIRSIDDSKEDIVRFLERNPNTSAVAICDNKIVGNILCGHDGRQGSFYHVCVAKNYRRHGIATKMAVFCMRALQDAGIRDGPFAQAVAKAQRKSALLDADSAALYAQLERMGISMV